MAGEPRIVAAAAVTPLGGSLALTAAMLRAGESAATAGALVDPAGAPYLVARCAVADGDVPGSARERRLAALLAAALRPLRDRGRLPLWLGMPEGVEAARVIPHAAVGATTVVGGGRTAALRAIVAAAGAVASGACRAALAGGVDSLIDARSLALRNSSGRARTLDGVGAGEWIGGEAAALVLVTSDAPGIRVLAFGEAEEDGAVVPTGAGTSDAMPPYRGEALALAARRALAPMGRPARALWWAGTAERWWAKEWGVAQIRCAGWLDPAADAAMPAEGCGDTGAASGALLAALAAYDLAHGGVGPSLVLAADDGRHRAALGFDRAREAA